MPSHTLKCRAALTCAALLIASACSQDPQRDPVVLVFNEPDQASTTQDLGAPDLSQQTPKDMPQDLEQPDLANHDAAPDLAPPAATRLARGVAITKINAYQSIQLPIMQDGQAAAGELPMISGKDTLFALHISAQADAETTITAQLLDANTDEVLTSAPFIVRGSSNDADRASIIELELPGTKLTPRRAVRFRLLGQAGADASSPTPDAARWPQDGSPNTLEATDISGALQLVIVPFRYNYDGSGRLPDTSDAQITLIRNLLTSLYPAASIDLQVRAPVDWDDAPDWGDFNVFLRQLKRDDNAPDQAYYYGMVVPDVDFATYCSGRCTTGQSFTVNSASATSYRVGTGVGWSGIRWAWTAAHEIGHMHGRGHAPCDVVFWDRDRGYPHNGGDIGVWAWDKHAGNKLYGPQERTDMMGYCDDLWISDYTYKGIYDRMVQSRTQLNALRASAPTSSPQRYLPLHWGPKRAPKWGRPSLEPSAPHTGQDIEVSFFDAQDQLIKRVSAPLASLSHDDERLLMLPPPPRGAATISVAGAGAPQRFALPSP